MQARNMLYYNYQVFPFLDTIVLGYPTGWAQQSIADIVLQPNTVIGPREVRRG